MKTLIFVIASIAILTAATGKRQVTKNAQSPSADTSMQLGGKNIIIEYNAPSARGRKVEGGLVPYGSVWRLGADAATTLVSDANLKIGNVSVPAGVHTLYIAASEGGWNLVVNKQTGQWGTEYSQGQDVGRAAMKVTKLSAPVETLKITLKSTSGSAGTMQIEWGNTQASVPIQSQ